MRKHLIASIVATPALCALAQAADKPKACSREEI